MKGLTTVTNSIDLAGSGTGRAVRRGGPEETEDRARGVNLSSAVGVDDGISDCLREVSGGRAARAVTRRMDVSGQGTLRRIDRRGTEVTGLLIGDSFPMGSSGSLV